jgi:hypothetical protein
MAFQQLHIVENLAQVCQHTLALERAVMRTLFHTRAKKLSCSQTALTCSSTARCASMLSNSFWVAAILGSILLMAAVGTVREL